MVSVRSRAAHTAVSVVACLVLQAAVVPGAIIVGRRRSGWHPNWRRRRTRSIAPVVVLLAIAIGTGSCGGGGSGNDPHAGTAKHTAPPKVATKPVDRFQQHDGRRAVAVLAALPTKGRAPMTGYSRAQFGPAWTDDNNAPLGHNGCDTRNDILRRDLTAGPQARHALRGRCPAPARPLHLSTIHFRRGETTITAVQIDHVVALGDAWQKGAQRWSLEPRPELANDPLELLAVDGPTNESKSDGDAATWLPPNTAYRCSYVARQIAVKARYGLWVTQAEHDAMARTLAKCPGQKVPRSEASHPDRPPSTPRHTKHTKQTKQTKGLYADCDEEEAAEALRRGQHGYGPERDGLGDGVACVSCSIEPPAAAHAYERVTSAGRSLVALAPPWRPSGRWPPSCSPIGSICGHGVRPTRNPIGSSGPREIAGHCA